jgi:prepilin-type N-terminal cleavage/methylation domain-containing protein
MKNKINKQTPLSRRRGTSPLKKGRNLKIKHGFTLIELLIVISIMGILTIIGMASFKTIQLKSRDARRKNDLNAISKSLNMYYNDVGIFPHGSPNIDLMIKTAGVGFSASVNGTVTTYMVEMPRETTRGVESYSYSSVTGKSFKLFTNLENVNDDGCLKDGSGNILMTFDSYNVEIGCIYGISSSNIKMGDDLL